MATKKRHRGRPALETKPLSRWFSVRLSEQEGRRIEALAAERGVKAGAILRELIRAGMEAT